jgi:hypothetical protein
MIYGFEVRLRIRQVDKICKANDSNVNTQQLKSESV